MGRFACLCCHRPRRCPPATTATVPGREPPFFLFSQPSLLSFSFSQASLILFFCCCLKEKLIAFWVSLLFFFCLRFCCCLKENLIAFWGSFLLFFFCVRLGFLWTTARCFDIPCDYYCMFMYLYFFIKIWKQNLSQ